MGETRISGPLSRRRLGPLCFLAAVFLLGIASLNGCGGTNDGQADRPDPQGPYQIATTVAMIGDIVEQVAGDRAQVTTIINAGVDPHTYTANSTDISNLYKADVIFYNGLMLEGKMGDTLTSFATGGTPVYAVTETIKQRGEYAISDEENLYDPHVWMDVSGWMRAVKVVRDKLGDYDPDHTQTYQTNAEAYLGKLEELDAYVKRIVKTIPKDQRVLVTAHDAFGYFGRAYGLEVRGIQGLSTEDEASVRDVENLVSMLVQREIPAVFVESSVSQKNVQALVEGARSKGHDLVIGGQLYSDAMGPPGTYEGTYIGMIDHNATTIVRALGGQAPAGGMQGKLSIAADTVAHGAPGE